MSGAGDVRLAAWRAVEWDPVRLRLEAERDRASRRVHAALCVAPRLDVLEALLAGETVPVSALDPVELRRRGIDPARRDSVRLADVPTVAGDGPRVTLDEIGEGAA